MASWSSRRRSVYGLLVIVAIALFVGVPIFYFLYKPATCSDNKQNGDETGIDCGGSCRMLCQSAFLPPRIEWGGAKFEKLAEGLYNASSYIVNPNTNGAAVNVPYKISLYDEKGILIIEREGRLSLYPHRNSMAFETAINVGQRIPAKAVFEFTQAPLWFKSHDALEGLLITDKRYEEDGQNSSLQVTLKNKTLSIYNNIQVSVILYDISGNVIGFSQTKIDSIDKNSSEIAAYTWPISRDGRVNSYDVILSTIPIADR